MAPSYIFGTNYRVLIYCTCHVQGSSLCFSFFCLLGSSMSDFRPNTRGAVVDTFFRLTCSVVLWGRRNTANKYHWHVWGVLPVSQPHWVCPRSQRVCPPCPHCSGCRLLHQEPSEASPGLHAPPRSKLLRFRHLGTPSSKAQTRLGLHFVPFPGPSSSCDQVLGECGRCELLPPLSLTLGFLGVQPVHLLRCAVCLFWGPDLWL